MKVFAIADLHLSGSVNKPMDIFGADWENHQDRVAKSWHENVTDDDIVLLPGDFSWAMTPDEALADLSFLEQLPGKKVLIRGNHDYWWVSLAKVRSILPPSIYVIQNDFFSYKGVHIAGTRGWCCPGSTNFTKHDEKLYQREINRLKLSVSRLPTDGFRVVMLHFPPFGERNKASGFTEVITEAGVDFCLYGHLHAWARRGAFEGAMNGVQYRLVSADHVGFKPFLIKCM